MKSSIHHIIILMVLFQFLFVCNLVAAEIETYPLPAVYPVSQTFSLEVENVSVPVTEFIVKGAVQYHYAHFSFSGSANINIKAAESINSCQVRPKAFDISANVNGSEAAFSISEPEYLVLYINNYEKLIILADPLETDPPDTSDPDVINILDYDVDSSGLNNETVKLQQALDDVNTNGGGVLYFPAGLYTITRVYVKSNTTVYLQGGAVIRGTGNKQDYSEYVHGSYERITHLFSVDGATNVRFSGRGTIDGYGVSLADNVSDIRDAPLKIRAISTENSSDVRVEGIIAREVTSWSVPFYYSDHLHVSRVKVLNYTGLKHSDGINMCASQYGRVEDCFVITGDDAFSSKDYGGEPTHDIIFRNCVGYSSTRGVTLGMQAYEQMYDIHYENIYMVGTRDGIDFKHDDGNGNWENITVKNVFVDECWGKPFNMHILEGGYIKDVTIENYQCNSSGEYSYINGLDENNTISNIAFIDLNINDQLVLDPAAGKFLINNFAENIVFAQVGNDTTYALGKMEAEDMIRENYTIESLSDASGEMVVVCNADSGKVSYFFTAATGSFDINIATWNENNQKSMFKLLLDDEMISSLTVGADPSAPVGNSLENHIVQNVQIETGQKITVVGIRDGSQISGLDYVEVTPFAGYYPTELEIEAESGMLGSDWIIENDEEASNGQAISSQCETCLNSPPADSAEIARYAFDILEGTYKLWFRIKHPSGEASDAFWFRMNEGDWQKWDQIAIELPDDQYYWDVNISDQDLNEGRNILEIGGCEMGTILDKIFLSQTGTIPEDTSSFEIYLEAESAAVGSAWSILESDLASGGQYIVSETASNMSEPPSDTSQIAVFNFQAIPGTYKVWIRMRHPDTIEDDSFWLRMNGGEWIRWNMIAYGKNATDFHWDVNKETFSLLPGSNTFEVGIRENGAELDMVYLSNSGSIPELPTAISDQKEKPVQSYQLNQNYPNPFNPSTTISYLLPRTANVKIVIYNIIGQKIKTLQSQLNQTAGMHSVIWHGEDDFGRNVSNGLYFYKLVVNEANKSVVYSNSLKMVLIK